METFDEIVNRIGMTDKGSTHTYTEWYDRWFEKWRKESIDILEIGVSEFGGGCLLALAEYFPNATIYGVDITMDRISDACRSHPRIKLIAGNGYDQEFMDSQLEGRSFPIIIDDARHESTYQWQLFKLLESWLPTDGMYIIEDVSSRDWVNWMTHEIHKLRYRHTLIDMQYITKEGHHVYDNALLKLQWA